MFTTKDFTLDQCGIIHLLQPRATVLLLDAGVGTLLYMYNGDLVFFICR